MGIAPLLKKIKAAGKARRKTDEKYDEVLEELLKHFEFGSPNEFELDYFHIEYQPSDGIVLADNDTNIYHLPGVIDYIKEHGSVKELSELKQFSI